MHFFSMQAQRMARPTDSRYIRYFVSHFLIIINELYDIIFVFGISLTSQPRSCSYSYTHAKSSTYTRKTTIHIRIAHSFSSMYLYSYDTPILIPIFNEYSYNHTQTAYSYTLPMPYLLPSYPPSSNSKSPKAKMVTYSCIL